uniref:(northern house mosquito) hypothetical protein n=1 Tax=Culex pipiens TaxID=7175 RepID=A0A8D8N420_CULPI
MCRTRTLSTRCSCAVTFTRTETTASVTRSWCGAKIATTTSESATSKARTRPTLSTTSAKTASPSNGCPSTRTTVYSWAGTGRFTRRVMGWAVGWAMGRNTRWCIRFELPFRRGAPRSGSWTLAPESITRYCCPVVIVFMHVETTITAS